MKQKILVAAFAVTALLSVSDKQGLAAFAEVLCRRHGYTLLSTGGTARLLQEKGLPVTEVGRHTGFPEIMDGRVKTLHPKIHGGLLCRRDKPEHLRQLEEWMRGNVTSRMRAGLPPGWTSADQTGTGDLSGIKTIHGLVPGRTLLEKSVKQ